MIFKDCTQKGIRVTYSIFESQSCVIIGQKMANGCIIPSNDDRSGLDSSIG